MASRLRWETIEARYARIGGFTHGFDYLRIALAVGVLLQHSVLSSYGDQVMSGYWAGWHRVLLAPILPMFFALSGFLVCGSLKKNPTTLSFLTLRIVRLVPALAVEILLSALVLGPLLTAVPLQDYFLDWDFVGYFGNIIGWLHFVLPGVFEDVPFQGIVNISLWTIPYELECYIALILLYRIGVIGRRPLLVALVAGGVVLGTATAFWSFDPAWAGDRPLPHALVVAFLGGVALNLYADRVVLNKWIAVAAFALLVAATLGYQTIYLAAVPAAYLAVYLGMMHPPKTRWLLSGDYSYGLYLFAFPIQQAYTHLFPDMRYAVLNAAFALVLGFAYAAFSWWCVERPILARKGMIVRKVEAFGNRRLFWRRRRKEATL